MADRTHSLVRKIFVIIIIFLILIILTFGIYYIWRKKQFDGNTQKCPIYSKITSIDIPGFDMAGNPHPNVKTDVDCQSLCNNTQGCNWYTYNKSSNNCYLKQGNNKPNVITSFKIVDTSNNIECPTYSRMTNIDIPGFDISENPENDVNTEVNCQNACDNKLSCNWYNFDTISNNCWIKQGQPNTNVVTGFKEFVS